MQPSAQNLQFWRQTLPITCQSQFQGLTDAVAEIVAAEDRKFLVAVEGAVMQQKAPLLGYKKSSERIWIPVYDVQTARDIDLDMFVFGSTTQECLQQLQVKFPPDDPGLTRVVLHGENYWCRDYAKDDSLPGDQIEIHISENQVYEGASTAEAIKIGQRLGRILVKERELVFDAVDQWLKNGFKPPPDQRWVYGHVCMTYDPKGARKLLKVRETHERKRPVRCQDLWPVYHALRLEIIRSDINMPHNPGNDIHGIVSGLMQVITLFNFLYGKNAHRRTAEFRKLKSEWKKREPQTVALFRNDKCPDPITVKYQLRDRRTFCNWMRAEIKVRNVPLHKGTWKPLRKMSVFDQFTDRRKKPMAKTAKKAAKKAAEKPAKKPATKKTTKKPAVKKAAKKPAKKPATKKPAAKKKAAVKRVRVRVPKPAPETSQIETVSPPIEASEDPEITIINGGHVDASDPQDYQEAVVNGGIMQDAPFDADLPELDDGHDTADAEMAGAGQGD